MRIITFYREKATDNRCFTKETKSDEAFPMPALGEGEHMLWQGAPVPTVLRWGSLVYFLAGALLAALGGWIFIDCNPKDILACRTFGLALMVCAGGLWTMPWITSLWMQMTRYYITTERIIVDYMWCNKRFQFMVRSIAGGHVRIVSELPQPFARRDICFFRDLISRRTMFFSFNSVSGEQVVSVKNAIRSLYCP